MGGVPSVPTYGKVQVHPSNKMYSSFPPASRAALRDLGKSFPKSSIGSEQNEYCLPRSAPAIVFVAASFIITRLQQ